MRVILVLVVVLFGISCNNKKDNVLILSDINTIGIKHRITYKEGLPTTIEYNTYIGTGTADSSGAENVIRIDIDTIIYDFSNKTILLKRIHEFKEKQIAKDYKKYYFNEDNLLYKSVRFNALGERVCDSIHYDKVTKRAFYYDLINNEYTELQYDQQDNIILELHRRIGDTAIVQRTSYTHDSFIQPYLVRLDKNEKLFGCFNIKSTAIFWNSFSRPVFCSTNNVVKFKSYHYGKESIGEYQYEYSDGLPIVRYGGYGVLYYRY